jgi:type IV secretory pathway VirJ component
VRAWRPALAALTGLILVQCASVDDARRSEVTSFGRFHELHLYLPPGPPQRLALLLSGDRGWSYHIASIARQLATDGTLVAGVDVRDLLASFSSDPAACVSPADDLAGLARALEQRYAVPPAAPVLIGHSAGATLAFIALAQAPPGTFAGAVTLSFCADFDLVKPLCHALAVPSTPRSGGVRLQPPAALPAPWIALHGLDDHECPPADSSSFAAALAGARFVPLAGVSHSYLRRDRWWPQFAAAYRELAGVGAGSGPLH